MTDPVEAPGEQDRADERFLVTGALGCIGAWTLRNLAREGTPVVAFDQATDPRRVRQICTDEELAGITFASGDITDLASVERALDEHGITNIIHLAALQVPFCRADPPLGARVNVLGTVNIFEAARRRSGRIHQVVYTGSIGMFDAADADPATRRLENDSTPHPLNHYGVYKQANEGTARVYWLENGLSEHRPPAHDGVRDRARPGPHELAHQGDRRRRCWDGRRPSPSAGGRCSSTPTMSPGPC